MTHAIPCPHCSNEIAIKDTRPGRFRVKCPRCSASFTLTVGDNPALPPVASIDGPTAVPIAVPIPAPAPIQPVSAPTPPPVVWPDDSVGTPPRWFAGYRVGERSSQSGPCPTYRARWRGLGRDMALTIQTPRRSADLGFIARWAREAYAASRLAHPNLASISELGVARGRPYLAGEPADPSAANRAEEIPRPDRAAIVACFLHAARGLKLAHDQYVFHRHLSPASLVDDERGVVRLVGLGAGMTPETPSLPAFAPIPVPGVAPAPPDPTDPAVIAVRDDIAALGVALRTALGVDAGRGLPPGLAAVVRRMVDGGPAGPFADLGAVIAALESELGVSGPFTPRDEEASAWEDAARGFHEPPLVRLRPLLVLGGWGLCGLLVLLFLLAGKPFVALGLIGFGGLMTASLVVVRGIMGDDPLARRSRDWLLGGSRADLATVAAGVGLAVLGLGAAHLLWLWLFLGGLAVALAVAYHFFLDRALVVSRTEALARASLLVRGLRQLGVEEEAIRRFACRQAGRDWEELYEALFGYDALRQARARWGREVGGGKRPRHAIWRDLPADLIDRKLAERRRVRDRVTLQAIEEHGREARGINLLTARRQGHRVSEAMVHIGDEYARSGGEGLGRPLMRAMIDASERPDAFLTSTWSDEARAEVPAWRVALASVASLLVGSRARFLVGGLLLAGSLIWMDQNGIISGARLKQEALAAVEDRGKALADAEALARKVADGVRGAADAAVSRPTQPLALRFLPPGLASRLDGLGLGLAGLILLVASVVGGTRIAFFVVPAALVAMVGPGLLDASAQPRTMTSLLCYAVAAALLGLGLVWGRERD